MLESALLDRCGAGFLALAICIAFHPLKVYHLQSPPETGVKQCSAKRTTTLATGPTVKGIILGTPQYMSPEQLNGEEADARSDIFAFGAIVYEMTTGKKAFEGRRQASLIAAILSSEPTAMSSLQPRTPLALERLVKKCLAKDPDDRWQTARDRRHATRRKGYHSDSGLSS
ncbi:protein kinase [Acidobacteria bacterium AH-259-G07]|nr:protein kinase [Acidobacteria bacterium AH-259-G07]